MWRVWRSPQFAVVIIMNWSLSRLDFVSSCDNHLWTLLNSSRCWCLAIWTGDERYEHCSSSGWWWFVMNTKTITKYGDEAVNTNHWPLCSSSWWAMLTSGLLNADVFWWTLSWDSLWYLELIPEMILVTHTAGVWCLELIPETILVTHTAGVWYLELILIPGRLTLQSQ